MRTRMVLLAAALVSSLCSAAEVCDAKFAKSALDDFLRSIPKEDLPRYGLNATNVGAVKLGAPLRMGVLTPDSLDKLDAKSTVESSVSFGARWLYPVEVSSEWVAFLAVMDDGSGCIPAAFGQTRLAKSVAAAKSFLGDKAPLDVVLIPHVREYHVAQRGAPNELLLVLDSNTTQKAPRFSTLAAVSSRMKSVVHTPSGGAR